MLSEMCANMEKEMVLRLEDEEEQDPTVQLWLYYFLAQHNYKIHNLDKAIEWVNKGIEHTPTCSELYRLKGKIY